MFRQIRAQFKQIFFILQLMKQGHITTHQKWMNNLNSGWLLMNMLRKRQKQFHHTGKIMTTVFWDSKGIILRLSGKRKTITRQYFADLLDRLMQNWQKSGWICPRKKCFFNPTMCQCTRLQLQPLNWLNYDMNCSLIHLLSWLGHQWHFFLIFPL